MNMLNIRNRVARNAWDRNGSGPHKDKKWHYKNRKRQKVKHNHEE